MTERDIDFLALQMIGRKRRQDDRERLAAISHLKRCAHHKGRPHFHAYQKRQLEKVAKKRSENNAKKGKRAHFRYVDSVRAYWRGDGDHP